ncbi:unnamed protein product [Acanthosepion pharaonis]|uniref:Uncharacterized protein n=1 Tax=Acanthosepion pharaonis TaxID=158019 RepID=A0A812DUN1_ACAPH|nr:unnamed protein product [Sepia pharaonis]
MADQSESEDLDTDRHRLSNQLMEDGNMVQKSNMYRVMLGHDGQSVSKPVDAQLFNVDLSSVPLPPAAATAATTVEDPMASTSHSSHRQPHTPRIPRTMNDYSPPLGSTVSSIALPPAPPPLPITTTTTTMHLPFSSSSDLSLNGSGVAQLASTVPQPVPPPLPLPLASVSTVPPLPPTPVPPVPPPPVMPVPPPVGILSLPTSSIGSYSSIAQCSTIHNDNVDRDTSFSEDRKDNPENSLKALSASLDSRKVVENSHQPGKKTGGIIRFSLKSPDGGGKPKVSFQIKRKNRPIVGDKSESIAEEEDIVNSNPGQFVTRKREMFKPAEVESVTPQQLAFIKNFGANPHATEVGNIWARIGHMNDQLEIGSMITSPHLINHVTNQHVKGQEGKVLMIVQLEDLHMKELPGTSLRKEAVIGTGLAIDQLKTDRTKGQHVTGHMKGRTETV